MILKSIPEIEKTTRLVQEIAAASNEQSNGANQVNSAMQQLNNVTQQNAAAREEMAISAEELASQADQLKETVSYFKTNGSTQQKPQVFENKLANKKPISTNNTQTGSKIGPKLVLNESESTDKDFEAF